MVRGGSWWFEEVRGRSMQSNHPELVHNHPTHIVPHGGGTVGWLSVAEPLRTQHKSSACPVSSAIELFEEVGAGSIRSNHPEPCSPS